MAGSSTFAADSGHWRAQVAELHSSIRDEGGEVSAGGAVAAGSKGAVEAVILALGSSGALVVAEHCFRAWLNRDKSRSLTITWTDEDGGERRISVSGERIDRQSFQALTESIGRMIEGR